MCAPVFNASATSSFPLSHFPHSHISQHELLVTAPFLCSFFIAYFAVSSLNASIQSSPPFGLPSPIPPSFPSPLSLSFSFYIYLTGEIGFPPVAVSTRSPKGIGRLRQALARKVTRVVFFFSKFFFMPRRALIGSQFPSPPDLVKRPLRAPFQAGDITLSSPETPTNSYFASSHSEPKEYSPRPLSSI